MAISQRSTPVAGPSADHGTDHRALRDDEFWRAIPGYRDVDAETFLDHRFQARHTLTKPKRLLEVLAELADPGFVRDVEVGFARAPMALRVSPYLLSLIDWSRPYEDPLRRQFIPVASEAREDHPKLRFDSLAEQQDAPVPGLTHRYPDKVLFLPVDTCPVYCRFCTRSYAVGPDREQVDKVHLRVSLPRWERAFDYLRAHPQVEDVVISGGDSYTLKPEQLRFVGDTLLDIPHIRRLRFATKGPAVMPQKLLTDHAWRDALLDVVQRGRTLHKQVALHTHFNHPNEITAITQRAMNLLFEHGVIVRNQSVLQRGVNDDARTMILLVRRLSYLNVQPYYVYMHDLVRGVEDLRTTLRTALDLEKAVRGVTAGFNTPTFVVDAPGGGGKRSVHSFEHYDEETGVSVFRAPSVKPGQAFCYYDPVQLLPEAGKHRWADAGQREDLTGEALRAAGCAADGR